MAKWSERPSLVLKVPCSKRSCALHFSKILPVLSAVNGHSTLFRAGEGEGDGE